MSYSNHYYQKPKKICICGKAMYNLVKSDICYMCRRIFLMSLTDRAHPLNAIVKVVDSA